MKIVKKIFLSLFILLLIIGVGALVFIDKLAKKGANMALENFSEEFGGKVSSLEVDLSEAKVSFDLALETKDKKEEFLNASNVVVDANFFSGSFDMSMDGLKADLTKNAVSSLKDYLAQASSQAQKQEQEEEEKSSGPLSSLPLTPDDIKLKNIRVTLEEAGFKAVVPLIDLDFSEGFGLIKDVAVHYLPQKITVVSLPEIALQFEENFFENEKMKMGVKVFDPSLSFSEKVAEGLQRLPQLPKTPEKKGEGSSFFLKSLLVNDFTLSLLADQDIFASMDSLDINFTQGQGEIRNVAARVDSASPFFLLETIELSFKGESLQGEGNAALKTHLRGAYANINPTVISALKQIPKMKPESDSSEKEKEQSSSAPPAILKEISQVELSRSAVSLHRPPLRAGLDHLLFSMDAGEIRGRDLTASLLSPRERFFQLDSFLVRFDPEEVIAGEKPELNAIINDFDLKVSQRLMDSLKSPEKAEEEKNKKPLSLPFTINRILVGSSSVSFLELPGVGNQKHLQINEIFGNINDLTFEAGTPLANYTFNATFEGETKAIAKGKMDLAHNPPQWSLNAKVFDFNMRKLNDELRERIPLTFKEGTFNIFAEAVSREGEIVGYLKPILKDAEYIGNEKDFQGPRHFIAEYFARFTNWLLENKDRSSVATRIPFRVEDGKLNTNAPKAAWRALEHGLLETKPVKPGIEDKHQLKQAQEEDK